MAKKESLTEKSDKELLDTLAEARTKLREERFAAAGARAKNPNLARALRRTLARALTEQGRRTSAASVSPDSRPATK